MIKKFLAILLFFVTVSCNNKVTTYSNLASENSINEISMILKKELNEESVDKYAHYTGEDLAVPFIMDNEKWIEISIK